MGLPSINIEFKSVGISAIERGERGIVAIILDDSTALGLHELVSLEDIPAGLKEDNIDYLKKAMIGYVRPPKMIKAYIANLSGGASTLAEVLGALELVNFDYLVMPEADDFTRTDTDDLFLQIKTWRDNMGKKVKAVLANKAADYEGIINFTTEDIQVGGKTYTAKQYTPRIAGLLAGTPLQISATFAPLAEVDNVPSYTKSELDSKINAGEFVIFHDGEKVKVGRAINSLITTNQDKPADWQKCKIVDILDLWYTDIVRTAEDNYIGKYANSYDNKLLLVMAITGYNEQLELDNILAKDQNSVFVDVEVQRAYLLSKGIDVSGMTEQEIKEAETDDKVFLGAVLKPLDAIEDITMRVFI